MLSPGDKVKDCEVIAPLGSGGMATLYLARRRGVGGFSRLVTLKLVHQHLAEDENIIKLFLEEARISAHVAHPNVVRVEEVGRYNGSYFIAMEYVHGVSLAELLARLTDRRLCLRPKLCVWLAAQIAEALHAAHEATGENGVPLDVVHRDVSPQNVLIGHTGHVKLIDFGLAKSLAGADQNGTAQTVLGKLRYMAPEQLRLEHADRRTDVYALGVMLWEMLADRSLLRCQRYDDERDWATRENPPPPSRYAPHPMPSLDRAVLKAIAYEPDERYESAFQFRAALLRAEPSVAQLDAPMVASLLRTMLGDELDKRSASWPSEVAGELEAASEQTGSVRYPLEELTAEHRTLSAMMMDGDDGDDTDARADAIVVDDEEDEPTLSMYSTNAGADSLATMRADLKDALNSASVDYDSAVGLRVEPAVVMLPAPVVTARERTLLGMPVAPAESAIDTLRVPPVTVTLLELLPKGGAAKTTMVGAACLTVGFLLGTWTTSGAASRNDAVTPENRIQAATDSTPAKPTPQQFASVVSTQKHHAPRRIDPTWYLVKIETPPAPLAPPPIEDGYGDESDDADELESSRSKSASRREARAKSSRRAYWRSLKAEKLSTSSVRKAKD